MKTTTKIWLWVAIHIVLILSSIIYTFGMWLKTDDFWTWHIAVAVLAMGTLAQVNIIPVIMMHHLDKKH